MVKVQNGIQSMKDELYKSYIGEAEIDRKYISQMLEKAEANELKLQEEINELKDIIKSKELAVEEYENTIKMVPVWKEVFEEAPLNIKKHLLSILIKKIIVKGNEVDIYFKVDIDSFLKIQDNSEVKVEANINREHYRKIIEDTVNVVGCGF